GRRGGRDRLGGCCSAGRRRGLRLGSRNRSGRRCGLRLGSRRGGGCSSQCGSGLLCGLALACLGGFALALFLLFALATLLGQVFLLTTQQLGLAIGFLLAAGKLGGIDRGCLRCRGLLHRGRDVVTFHEDALLAHLDLDRACLAGRVGLLDLGGRLLREGDLLALAAAGAVGVAQVVEQSLLVCLGQRVIGRRLGDAG